jgi:hypothetical protein
VFLLGLLFGPEDGGGTVRIQHMQFTNSNSELYVHMLGGGGGKNFPSSYFEKEIKIQNFLNEYSWAGRYG